MSLSEDYPPIHLFLRVVMMTSIYVIDTSSLTRLRPNNSKSTYDLMVFPGVLDALTKMINDQVLFSSLLVLEELKDYSSTGDKLLDWALKHKDIFIQPNSDIQMSVRAILKRFPTWIDVQNNRNDADPFVVATALFLKATVITEENEVIIQPNTRKIKIPNVCKEYQINCCNFLELMRNSGFRFSMISKS